MAEKKLITYEIPAHFLTKSALRLETLLHDMQIACEESHYLIHQHALASCIEIINLTSKPELKSRFLKELLRIEHNLDKSQVCVTNDLSHALSRHIQHLSQRADTFAGTLTNDPFIHSIRSLSSSNSQEIDSRSPKLLLWLHSSCAERQAAIKNWIEKLTPLHYLIKTYLGLLRKIVLFDEVILHQGYYQCLLPAASTCHLILIRLYEKDQFIPHIQIGQQRLTLTLQKAFAAELVSNCPETIEFGLSQL